VFPAININGPLQLARFAVGALGAVRSGELKLHHLIAAIRSLGYPLAVDIAETKHNTITSDKITRFRGHRKSRATPQPIEVAMHAPEMIITGTAVLYLTKPLVTRRATLLSGGCGSEKQYGAEIAEELL
jgi:hypothetical protein